MKRILAVKVVGLFRRKLMALVQTVAAPGAYASLVEEEWKEVTPTLMMEIKEKIDTLNLRIEDLERKQYATGGFVGQRVGKGSILHAAEPVSQEEEEIICEHINGTVTVVNIVRPTGVVGGLDRAIQEHLAAGRRPLPTQAPPHPHPPRGR